METAIRPFSTSLPSASLSRQQNQTVSTYYLHCITRLCDRTTCRTFKQFNRRRRRAAETPIGQDEISDEALFTSGPIKTMAESSSLTSKEEVLSGGQGSGRGASGLEIAMAVLIVVGVAALMMAATFYCKRMWLS
ncbi:zona pellucida-like domain-containing protein 1 isoform X2 [Salmo trutta]|uniref:zona pellucida-like domain-containing protein 1 isoform X2 n=1 Tax=Salmo trutta TaxID=8032 RepID=UPI0011311CB6|nr:zona pellucida-like domain-containing protein 1 isoform X2 [Salmo trutta]